MSSTASLTQIASVTPEASGDSPQDFDLVAAVAGLGNGRITVRIERQRNAPTRKPRRRTGPMPTSRTMPQPVSKAPGAQPQATEKDAKQQDAASKPTPKPTAAYLRQRIAELGVRRTKLYEQCAGILPVLVPMLREENAPASYVLIQSIEASLGHLRTHRGLSLTNSIRRLNSQLSAAASFLEKEGPGIRAHLEELEDRRQSILAENTELLSTLLREPALSVLQQSVAISAATLPLERITTFLRVAEREIERGLDAPAFISPSGSKGPKRNRKTQGQLNRAGQEAAKRLHLPTRSK